MRTFEAKNLDLALQLAAEDLGVEIEELIYDVLEEKKGFLKKFVKIGVFETSDIAEYATSYLELVVKALGLEPTFEVKLEDKLIKIEMDTNHNSILIGKNGRTLLALNELVTLAVSVKFKKRSSILVDINDYKNERYRRVVSIAKKVAGEVAKTRQTAILEPMPADERRAVHNALGGYRNVETESEGTGRERKIKIKYKNQPKQAE